MDWIWVWTNSGRYWRTGKPGVLQSMGLQRVRHNWVTEQQYFTTHYWSRDRLPTPVFLGFPCGPAGKVSACNVGDLVSIPGLGRSPGEMKGYPLQYSGLEIYIVHGVPKSWTWLIDFHFFHFHYSQWPVFFFQSQLLFTVYLVIHTQTANHIVINPCDFFFNKSG